MGLRTSTEIEFLVGHDNSLTSDMAFEGLITGAMLDTLDHVESGVYDLAAGEQNVPVDFGDVAQCRILYLEANGEIDVTLGGVPGTVAQFAGGGGTFPTGFVGGETFGLTIDTLPIAVVFTAADQSALQVARRINAAIALLGMATPRVTVAVGGQLVIAGLDATISGKVQITTAHTTIGYPALTTVYGVNPIPGSAPFQVQRPADPSGASAAEGVDAFFFATVRCTSILISNPSTTVDVRVKVGVVGDLIS
jgi:hypothetical protein